VIVIGASSGIGKEVAKFLSTKDWIVGLAARRINLLSEIQKELSARSYVKRIDLAQPNEAIKLLGELIEEMGGVDVIVLCSAVCFYNPDLNWQEEQDTVNIDVVGVTAVLNAAFNHFNKIGKGHIVGISSFKSLRGGGKSPAYNASKAFLSNYLEGLRINSRKWNRNVAITDIRPGFVTSSHSVGKRSMFVTPAETVALQIYKAIDGKKGVVYIPRWYWTVALLMRIMPFSIYCRL